MELLFSSDGLVLGLSQRKNSFFDLRCLIFVFNSCWIPPSIFKLVGLGLQYNIIPMIILKLVGA